MIKNDIVTSLAKLVLERANAYPDRNAYYELKDNLEVGDSITYNQLLERSLGIAQYLMEVTQFQEPVILMYDSSIDFVTAFFACSLSGRIAVPVYPPITKSSADRIQHIAKHSHANLILTHPKVLNYLRRIKLIESASEIPVLGKFVNAKLLSSEASLFLNQYSVIDSTTIIQNITTSNLPSIDKKDIAFIQYTSGSTSKPKGVIVTHENILANESIIQKAMGLGDQSKLVTWLPVSHDMGLIGSVIQPIYALFPVHILTPFQFIKNPLIWLTAIDAYKFTVTGGPNFAYELCTTAYRNKNLNRLLDLSSVEVFYNGAEPIHHETMDHFINTFAPFGVSRKQIYPCYGLAESTLFVSGKVDISSPHQTIHLDLTSYQQNKIKPVKKPSKQTKTLVSSGQIIGDTQVLIMNTNTLLPCAADEIGEIVIKGDSVTSGYWKNSKDSKELFISYGCSTYLKTGDVGFMHGDNLYVTGRKKDLIIINGKNYYPQDIEHLVMTTSPYCRKAGVAAFSIEKDNSEKLIIIIEIKLATPELLRDLEKGIRHAVLLTYQLEIERVVFAPPKSLPKTTSGKLQRSLCKVMYMENKFE